MSAKSVSINRLKIICVVIGVACWIPISGWVGFEPVAAQEDADQKALQMRHTRADGDFKVYFQPVKAVYHVDEEIKFKIKGNRDFFLYLFSINTAEDRAVLLIPSYLQKGNKYKECQNNNRTQGYLFAS